MPTIKCLLKLIKSFQISKFRSLCSQKFAQEFYKINQ